MKFLGVVIDQKLSWHEHINYTQKKIAKGLAIMNKSKRCLSKKSMVQLYQSYINPYLIYCSEVWGNASEKYLSPIIKLQKKGHSNLFNTANTKYREMTSLRYFAF